MNTTTTTAAEQAAIGMRVITSDGTGTVTSLDFSASGWSFAIDLDAQFAHVTPSGSVRRSIDVVRPLA